MGAPPRFETDVRGWNQFLPVRAPTSPLSGNRRVDVAIIGAGITGLSAAHRLAEIRPDAEIVVLDARAVGQGASGRNSGYAVATSHFPGPLAERAVANCQRVNRINVAGLARIKALVERHGIACDLLETGIHHAAADTKSETELAHFRAYLDRLAIPATPLDADDLADRLGTRHYRGGVHVHGGALVQPAALVRGLADALPETVTLHENTPATALLGGATPCLETPGGTVTADRVIVAANFEATRLGLLRGAITASTLSGSFTRPLTDEECATLGTRPQWGVLSLHSGGATVRLTADRRICLRNTAEFTHGHLLDDRQLADRVTIHRQSFEQRFPQLAHVPFDHSWSGVEGISRNGTNFFGEKATNIWLAGGFNGSGVSRGAAFGMAIADASSGRDSQTVSDCLASPKAQWIPPRPFLNLGAAWTVNQRFKGVGRDR